MIVALAIAIVFLFTMIFLERSISKIMDDQKEGVERYVDNQKRLYRANKQVQYLNIFLKEIKEITNEQHYGSVINLEKKLRSAVEDIETKLHFID